MTAQIYAKVGRHMAHAPGDHVSADLSTGWPLSIHGFLHFLLIVDWCSNKFWHYLLRTRAESHEYLNWWMIQAKTHLGHAVKVLHIDSGEMKADIIDEMCKKLGTIPVYTGTGQSKQNTRAERGIRTSTDMIVTMLSGGGATKDKWEFPCLCAQRVLGILPKMVDLQGPRKNKDGGRTERPLTPDEIWNGEKYNSYKDQTKFVFAPFCLGVRF